MSTQLIDRYLSNIGSAKVGEGGVFFIPGDFIVHLDSWKFAVTRAQRPFCVAETTILWSNTPERKPGSKCAHMIMLDRDSSPGNVKGFMAGVHGVDWKTVPEGDWTMITKLAADQDGLRLRVNQQTGQRKVYRVQASNTEIKGGPNAGKPYTNCFWTPYDGANPVPQTSLVAA